MAFEGVDPTILKNFIDESGLAPSASATAYVFTCPRCNGAKKLYVRKRDGRFICWKCAETDRYQGRAEFALADLTGLPLGHVRNYLYGIGPVQAQEYIKIELLDPFRYGEDLYEEDEVDISAKLPDLIWPPDYFPIDDPRAYKGLEYVVGRGVPLSIAKQYHLYYSPAEKRVCIPVEVGEKLVGWQARLIIPNKEENPRTGRVYEIPKILSSDGLRNNRSNLLMFSNNLIGSEHAVLCEGPFDGIKAHFCGGAVVTMGKSVSAGQVKILRESGIKKLYLALDPDAAEETARLVADLRGEMELYQMEASGGGKADLGGMTFEEVYEAFLDAKRIVGHELFVYLRPIR